MNTSESCFENEVYRFFNIFAFWTETIDINKIWFFVFQEFAETSLHYAISHETGHSLHMVDFIVQNSSSLDKQTREGNTPLHYCVIQNQCESMRLLLRSGANPGLENKNGKTPLSIAKERGHELCEELVS